jgi:hypothetical protein
MRELNLAEREAVEAHQQRPATMKEIDALQVRDARMQVYHLKLASRVEALAAVVGSLETAVQMLASEFVRAKRDDAQRNRLLRELVGLSDKNVSALQALVNRIDPEPDPDDPFGVKHLLAD